MTVGRSSFSADAGGRPPVSKRRLYGKRRAIYDRGLLPDKKRPTTAELCNSAEPSPAATAGGYKPEALEARGRAKIETDREKTTSA